jgi:ATP-dependent Clp protease ATP-binding subunit ClpC
MFERFTDRARGVVVLAQEEAQLLKHNYIGTEHILLGLARDNGSVAGRALRRLSIDVEAVRAEVLEIIGRGGESPSGHIPFTPRAKKVLELSLREALQLGHNYIGTEHILLGLVREGEGVAAQVIVKRGVDLDRVRETVLQQLEQGGDSPAGPPGVVLRYSPAADDVLAAARVLAAGGPVGSHHLLAALARSEDSAAAQALVAVGVDPEALAAALDAVSLEQTSDMTPLEAAARQVELRLEGDRAALALGDEATVERIRALSEQLGGPIRGDDPAVGPLSGLWRAVSDELDKLEARLVPTEPSDDEPRRSRIVRHALQSRLGRRRDRPA